AQMLAQVQNAVDAANAAYLNSQVTARLRLVQATEVNYAETPDFFQMLEWVRTDPTVAARRNACQADLVSMLVNNTSLGGRGYLMQSGNIGPAFEAYAFSVVCWYYASSYYVLAHEVGHNLGCHHDVANTTEQGAYPFSYGQYYSGIYRTVMAYDNGCQCPMYAGFSNPNLTFQNLPTGIVNQTDNAQTINQTAPIAANFRGPGGTIPSLTLAAPNGGETLMAGTAVQIVWTTTTDYLETAVRLELMRNGTLQQVISASTSAGSNGIGTFSWTIPTNVTPGNDYQIRVSHPSNSTVQDVSDATFTLSGPNTATLTVTTPNGGESWALNTRQTVRWTYSDNPGSAVKVELFKNGILRQVIAAAAPVGSNGSGSFDWDISSAELPGNDYTVKITSTSFSTISDVSNNTFSLGSVPVNATIQVVTPNGGEKWKPRTQQQILWSFTGNPGAKVKVELYKGGVFKQVISAGVAIGTNGAGSLSWLVPSTLAAGSDYKIKITSTTTASATDFSNQNFSVIR
ncbi:MAG TPA: Ser-Thr-rich GPI-anchored membrane family protein, partial [Acidobacteriota bacterium]|nr:Ser-Thr-rich GPI-anchored membrane family protein [Acidobacteriota bacterium]